MSKPKRRVLDEAYIRQVAAKYNSRAELKKADKGVLQKAYKLKIINDIFPKLERRELTEQFVRQEARKYETLMQMKKADKSLLDKAYKLGIVRELFTKTIRDLNEQLVREVASGYKTRKELSKNDKSVHSKLIKLNILDEIFPHPTKKAEYISLTRKCYHASRKCKNRTDMRYKYSKLYRHAEKHKMLDRLFPTMEEYYSIDNIKKMARKCKDMEEFEEKYTAAYYRSLTLGINDELF